MNLDINALLNGAGGKPGGKLLTFTEIAAGDSFEQLIDEKLAGLDIVLPMPGELVLPSMLEGELELVDLAPGAMPQDDDGALTITQLPMPVPVPNLLSDGVQSNPAWQLQQLVTENGEALSVDMTHAGKLQTLLPEMMPTPAVIHGEKTGLHEAGALAARKSAEKLPLSHGMIQSTVMLEGATGPATEALTAQPQIADPRPVVLGIMATQAAMIPSTTPAAVIEHQVGTPAWQHSVSQQIALFTRNGVHNAEIKLHPEELGSLQINMRMQQDRAQMHFISEHPHVRQAMEAAMPQLRAALADAGVQLGQTNVSADTAHSAGANADGQHAGQGSAGQEENALNPEDDNQHEILTKVDVNISGINTFV